MYDNLKYLLKLRTIDLRCKRKYDKKGIIVVMKSVELYLETQNI